MVSNGATPLSIMTLIINGLFEALGINDTQKNSIACHYAECRYVERHHAECRGTFQT